MKKILLAATLLAFPAGATYLPGLAGSGGTPATGTGVQSDVGILQFIMQEKSTATLYYVDCASIAGITCPTVPVAPNTPTIALGTPTATVIPFTITAPAAGSAITGYVVGYRVTGSGAVYTTLASQTGLTGTVPTADSTAYDVEVTATNGAGSATSAVVNVTTPAPPVVSAAINTPPSGTAGQPLTLSGAASNIATVYVSYAIDGVEQGSRVAATVTGGSYSTQVTPAAVGSDTASVYAAATAGIALATTGTFTIATAPPSGIGPSITLTGASYDTATPKFGTGALSTGSGTATLTVPSRARTYSLWFKSSTSVSGLLFADQNGNGILLNPGCSVALQHGAGTNTGSSAAPVCDGTWHYLAVSTNNDPGMNVVVDGNNAAGTGISAQVPANPTMTLSLPAGAEVDEVAVLDQYYTGFPSAGAYTNSTPNLVVDWAFDGNNVSR